jgi:hypothetical protein
VPVNARLLLTVNVLPSAIVNVALVAGAVKDTLLMLVAVATPSVGVTNVGLVANTNSPDPVSPVTAAAKLALEGVTKKVAIPAPNPDTPVDIGNPVQLTNTPAEGVPKSGVTSVLALNSSFTVICLVTPPCTNGKTSAPAADVAEGS